MIGIFTWFCCIGHLRRPTLQSYCCCQLRQVFPWQVFPWQVFPGQVFPWQIFPWQVFPGQVFPWQVFLWQVFPWQIFPWQVFPWQDFPWQVSSFSPWFTRISFDVFQFDRTRKPGTFSHENKEISQGKTCLRTFARENSV